eukprot:3854191-Rhodomonas_salina.3
MARAHIDASSLSPRSRSRLSPLPPYISIHSTTTCRKLYLGEHYAPTPGNYAPMPRNKDV